MARKTSEISLTSIAKELGISASTVSRVLNNRSGVGESLRRTILEAAKARNFKTNYPARRLPRIAIASTCPLEGNYTGLVKSGIAAGCEIHGLTGCDIIWNRRKQESLLNAVRDQQCSGIILVIAPHFESDFQELSASGIPVMTVDERIDMPNFGSVNHDSYRGMAELTEYLLSQGHRKIGLLGCSNGTENHESRIRAYREVMSRNCPEFSPEWTVCPPGDCYESGAAGFRRLRIRFPDMTAFIGINDDYAIGAIHATGEWNLSVPGDVAIAGFDDFTVSRYLNPSLTTVYHPCRLAGYLAVRALGHYLHSSEPAPLPNILLPVRLRIRRSA